MLHLNKEERCGSILTCSSEDGQDYDTPGATKISGPWRMRKCKHMTSFWLWQLDRCLFVLFIGHQLVWTCWGGGSKWKEKTMWNLVRKIEWRREKRGTTRRFSSHRPSIRTFWNVPHLWILSNYCGLFRPGEEISHFTEHDRFFD
jgi:hypothetical protein